MVLMYRGSCSRHAYMEPYIEALLEFEHYFRGLLIVTIVESTPKPLFYYFRPPLRSRPPLVIFKGVQDPLLIEEHAFKSY